MLRAERAHRPAEHGVFRQNVVGMTGGKASDADNGRVERIQLAADDGMKRLHEGRAGKNDVAALLRHRRMGAAPFDRRLETVGARHHGSIEDGDRFRRQPRPVVQAKDHLHRKAREQTFFHHASAAAFVFFGGLEDQIDDAVDFAGAGQMLDCLGRRDEHRRMPIVATGVHTAGHLRAMRKIVFFLQGQRIHVGAQADRPFALAAANDSHDAGLGNSRVRFDPQRPQALGDDGRRAPLLESQFRMGMQIPAQLTSSRHDFRQNSFQLHAMFSVGLMNTLPSPTKILVMSHPILFSETLRAIEQRHANAEPPLMERAGAAAAALAERMLDSRCASPLVLAGPGNNGGDAFVVARLLQERGHRPRVLFVGDPTRLPVDARRAFEAWRAAGGVPQSEWPAEKPSLLIDGLFGIGLSRPIGEPYASWIERANREGSPILALDVPSGLDAEHGRRAGPAIMANRTATFIALKPGLLTGEGPDHCGEVTLCSLALTVDRPDGWTVTPLLFHAYLRPRRKNTHKGDHGAVAVIGGARGMTGAALLAGRAALALGAGRVYVGLAEPVAVDFLQPELMLRSPENALSPASVVAIGPGLGRSLAAHDPLLAALDADKPLILDADALNLVAESPLLRRRLSERRAATLLTPHPGEAARLLETDSQTIQSDRLAAAKTIARRFRAHVVLKGCGSIIVTPDGEWFINTSGNAGLASAGSGDVLTGMLAALLAQGWPPLPALQAAVHLHGLAAERLAAEGTGPVGLTASELIPTARRLLNEWITRFGC